MDKGDGKPADDTPLSPQWLSLAPQRSSSLSTQDSLGPVHSALLASDALDSRSDAPSRPSSRSLSTSRSLSSQWGSSNEQRKTSSGNVSLPSELLFPGVESYGWGEGKSGRSNDLGWHAKKKQGDSSSFEAGGSGSGGLYSPLGTGRTSSLGGRPTGSKPRDISRGWGYQSSAEGRQDGRRRSDHHDGHSGRGSFSGSYGTSQEGYENFKPSSSFDKRVTTCPARATGRARGGTGGTARTGAGGAGATPTRGRSPRASPFSPPLLDAGATMTLMVRPGGPPSMRRRGPGPSGRELVPRSCWTPTTPRPTGTAGPSCTRF